MNTISILGCGWYGCALGVELNKKGIIVKGSTTTAAKISTLAELNIKPFLVNLGAENTTYDPSFFDCDLLIVSIPPHVHKGDGENFITKINQLISILQKQPVNQMIYISSTGVYGDNQGVVNELNEPVPDTESGELLLKTEQLLQIQTTFTTTIIRFGGLIGPARHPGRFFAGKKDIPNGQTPVNLIHLDDAIGITLAIIENQSFKNLFNACSANHMVKADFYSMAARNASLPVPKFKNELISFKQVNSLNVPAMLKYKFKRDNWEHIYTIE